MMARSAFTVRPWRPITFPRSSSATLSSSTTVSSSSSNSVHLDLVGLVDQRPGEELEQLLQALIPFALRSFFTVPQGCAPLRSQLSTRSSSSSIVDGSVCGL